MRDPLLPTTGKSTSHPASNALGAPIAVIIKICEVISGNQRKIETAAYISIRDIQGAITEGRSPACQ